MLSQASTSSAVDLPQHCARPLASAAPKLVRREFEVLFGMCKGKQRAERWVSRDLHLLAGAYRTILASCDAAHRTNLQYATVQCSGSVRGMVCGPWLSQAAHGMHLSCHMQVLV